MIKIAGTLQLMSFFRKLFGTDRDCEQHPPIADDISLNECLGCKTRYSSKLSKCPNCGSTALIVVRGTSSAVAETPAPPTGKPEPESKAPVNSTTSFQKGESSIYYNSEWNFKLTLPDKWKVIGENYYRDPQWLTPVQIEGPRRVRENSFFTVKATIASRNDGLDAYLLKAESDLAGMFSGFNVQSRRKETLSGWGSAWLSYSYEGQTGPRTEMNITTFCGRGPLILFQFLCETDAESAPEDFPVFEHIARSLKIRPTGLRFPILRIANSKCVFCKKALDANDKASGLVWMGDLRSVCDDCYYSYAKAQPDDL